MMSSNLCVFGLNSRAAALIRHGDNKRAIALLVKAVSLISSHLDGDESPEDSVTKPGTSARIERINFEGAVANTTSVVISVTSPLEFPMSSSATPYYNRPFLLELSSSEYSITDMAEKCAHILFNMALAYHQEGVTTGKSKRTLKALLLYQQALLALEGSVIQKSSKLILLFLAIVNNMAHIQVEIFDADGLQRSRAMLHAIMFHEDRAELDAESRSFFFLNMLFLDRDDVFKLPAAA
jgi:tetratricopeptide (TPR) repeat protein